MPGMREQEILTPPCILAVPRALWGRIALDPCAPVGANPCEAQGTYDRDGTVLPWAPETYANPPFGALKEWLETAARSEGELVMLVPARSHRTWWCDLVGEIADLTCWLRPVTFVGFTQSYPAPLVLLYRGALRLQFRIACHDLGCVTTNPFKVRHGPR